MPSASDTTQQEQVDAPTTRRLYRSRSQKVVAGVCGGLGEYFGADPVWFRIGFVLLAIGGGSGILIYLLMWLIIQPQPHAHAEPAAVDGALTGAAIVGVVLVFVGTITLVNTVAPWLGQFFWPVILVVAGFGLLVGGLNRDTR